MNEKGYTKGFEAAKIEGSTEERNKFLLKFISECFNVSVNDESFGEIFEKACDLLPKRKFYNAYQQDLKKIILDLKKEKSGQPFAGKKSEVLYGHGTRDLNRILYDNKNDLSADDISAKEHRDDQLYKVNTALPGLSERERVVIKNELDIGNDDKNKEEFNKNFKQKLSKERIRQIKVKGINKLSGIIQTETQKLS